MEPPAIQATGLVKHFGDVEAVKGVVARGAHRHRARSARPERRRQDHRRAHAHHDAPTRRRHARRCSASTCRKNPQRSGRDDRPRRPVRRRRREPHRAREPLAGRAGSPICRKPRSTGRAPTSCSSSSSSPTPPTARCKHVLGRHAPAARPRRRARAPPAGAVPRRAHHRARPAGPQRALGRDRGSREPRAPRVLLTTQYLEEADRSPTTSRSIDHGSVIAEGTATELKERLGATVVEITIARRRRSTTCGRASSRPVGPTSLATASSCR